MSVFRFGGSYRRLKLAMLSEVEWVRPPVFLPSMAFVTLAREMNSGERRLWRLISWGNVWSDGRFSSGKRNPYLVLSDAKMSAVLSPAPEISRFNSVVFGPY